MTGGTMNGIDARNRSCRETAFERAAPTEPKSSKMYFPATQQITMMTNARRRPLAATAFRVAGSSSEVRPRNTGVLARGFMMAKNPIEDGSGIQDQLVPCNLAE